VEAAGMTMAFIRAGIKALAMAMVMVMPEKEKAEVIDFSFVGTRD
jgi:hypothetical protein